jgi:hypothetical protein
MHAPALAQPAPAAQTVDWKPLATAYNAHHFNCQLCIAAGRGAEYGQRCETGLSLWKAYQEAAVPGGK